ncbi:MAG: hypothetical protein M1831_000218 [Alyxoria varia]|nr:MAG: hypothetical protein M1831_000218 [Alyxoria varia]
MTTQQNIDNQNIEQTRQAAQEADAPYGQDLTDDSYIPKTAKQEQSDNVPVQGDGETIETGPTEDTDAQLHKDDVNAIDESNIMGSRTRGAKPVTGNKYSEGPDEDNIPTK